MELTDEDLSDDSSHVFSSNNSADLSQVNKAI